MSPSSIPAVDANRGTQDSTPFSEPIPLVDLRAQFAGIEREVTAAIHDALKRADYVLGRDVGDFERAFADYCGAAYCVGVGSGTDALHLACRAADVGPGDEVIVPAFTFAATALAVTLAGATPVLADVRASDGLIDPDSIERVMTQKTRAIIAVHLYGQCADMDRIHAIARRRELVVIEDAAQAHGARQKGRRAGALGDLGCFSFYPSKNLGAYGDGGAVTTSDETLAKRLQALRNWGSRKKYYHERMGLNSRLDTIHAAALAVKLSHLDAWNERRRELAKVYRERLLGIDGLTLPESSPDNEHVYHLFAIRVSDRQSLLDKLHRLGIGAGIHYPFAVHQLEAFQSLGSRMGGFPESERWAASCLSLPLYPEMTAGMVERIADSVRRLL